MPDMLVKLLELPDYHEDMAKLKEQGINIRRIQPYEISLLRRFVMDTFGEGWADEVMNAFTHQPVTCYIATKDKKIIGFGAYECTRRDYFGPTGLAKEYRGRGSGKVLYLACMHGLHDLGYVYGIVGGAGPVDFYAKCSSATVIPDSMPGCYGDDELERETKSK